MKAYNFMLFPILLLCSCCFQSNAFKERSTLQSPGYPRPYEAVGLKMIPVITEAGKRLQFAVNVVDLAVGDWLQLSQDKLCEISLTPIFKGGERVLNEDFFTPGNEGCFKYSLEGSGKGFSITVKEIPACTGNYTSDAGDIISPAYPLGYYPFDTHCTWLVSVSPGQRIWFRVDYIDIEQNSGGCKESYLKIFDPKDSSPYMQICGKDVKANIFNTNGRTSGVEFKSRGRTFLETIGILFFPDSGYGGFHMVYGVTGCKRDGLPTDSGELVNEAAVFDYGYEANLRCPYGFKHEDMVGASDLVVLTCKEDGLWHGQKSKCQEIRCGRPGGPADGTFNLTSDLIKSTVIYNCNTGFTLEGANVRTCLQNGSWSDDIPVCVGKHNECEFIGDPTNGFAHGTNHSTGSLVSFQCKVGYTLIGHNETICEKTGQWTNPSPSCEIVKCLEEIAAPENGFISNYSNTYGSVVEYSCHRGYRLLNGSEDRKCQESGHWDGKVPTCAEVFCDEPTEPIYGNLSYDHQAVGGQVNYSCSTGYELLGASTAYCNRLGKWSADRPECRAKQCRYLGNLTNIIKPKFGHWYGDQGSLECLPGFSFEREKLVTALEIRCTESGKWNVTISGVGCSFETTTPSANETKAFPSSTSTPNSSVTLVSNHTELPMNKTTAGGTTSSFANQTTSIGTATSFPTSTEVPTSNRTAESWNGTTGGGLTPTGSYLKHKDTHDNSGTIAGIGVACGVILICLVALGLWFLRRPTRRAIPYEQQDSEPITVGDFQNPMYQLEGRVAEEGDVGEYVDHEERNNFEERAIM